MSDKFVPPAECVTMLQQLGGHEFVKMTGASQFLTAEVSDSNPNPWLRMNLPRNPGGVNRLKITLMANDTYTLEFYHQKLVDWEPVISKKQEFEMVYAEDLRSLFTRVTGFTTYMPVIKFR